MEQPADGYTPEEVIGILKRLSDEPGWAYLLDNLAITEEAMVRRITMFGINHDDSNFARGYLAALRDFMDSPERIVEQAKEAVRETERQIDTGRTRRRNPPRGL